MNHISNSHVLSSMKPAVYLPLILATTVLSIATTSFGQKPEGIHEGKELKTNAFDTYSFSSEDEAEKLIADIMSVVGLKPNFEIKEGDVENAAAVVYKGKRYILYNAEFIKKIKKKTRTDWAGISILAHEIGHHLNGHTITGRGSHPETELEADEFSGFVLRKMGATLNEAQIVMRTISSERGSATHPGKSQRLASIRSGWKHADSQINGSISPGTPAKPEWPDSKSSNQTEPVLAGKYIYKEVHFFNLPKEKYYLTIRYNLVQTDSGIKVLGKMVQSGKNFYLTMNKTVFKIDAAGNILNSGNKKVGYFRDVKV
jgi:hypothetical protein